MNLREDDEGFYILECNKYEIRFLNVILERIGIVKKNNEIIYEEFQNLLDKMERQGIMGCLSLFAKTCPDIKNVLSITFDDKWNFNETLQDKYWNEPDPSL